MTNHGLEPRVDVAVNYPVDLANYRESDELMLQELAFSGSYDLAEQMLGEKLYTPDPTHDSDTPLYAHIALALMEPDVSRSAELQFDAGVEVGAVIVGEHKSPRALTVAYLRACHDIDIAKVGISGHDVSPEAMNGVMHYTRLTVVESMEPSLKTIMVVEHLKATLLQLYDKNERFGWFMPKIELLHGDLVSRYNAHQVLETNSVLQGAASLESDKFEQSAVAVSSVMAHALNHRKYGLKPAYLPAAMGGNWVYYDGHNFAHSVIGTGNQDKLITPMVATIMHTDKSKLHDLQLGKPQVTSYGAGQVKLIQGAMAEILPDAVLHLGIDGELYLDSFGMLSLKRELHDSPGVYAALSAELISNFHDLTVPVGFLRRNGLRNITETGDSATTDYRPINDLLIPRVKAHNNATETEVTDTGRTVREHDVTWFVRLLPDGWRASPDAQANAKMRGINLADNETFVREHSRGSGNKVLGHRIVERATSV